MPRYAVSGASGHFGRRVVEELVDRGVRGTDIVAIARTTGKAADLAARGVQLRPGDYSRPETLPAALMGVERLLLISGSELGRRVRRVTERECHSTQPSSRQQRMQACSGFSTPAS